MSIGEHNIRDLTVSLHDLINFLACARTNPKKIFLGEVDFSNNFKKIVRSSNEVDLVLSQAIQEYFKNYLTGEKNDPTKDFIWIFHIQILETSDLQKLSNCKELLSEFTTLFKTFLLSDNSKFKIFLEGFANLHKEASHSDLETYKTRIDRLYKEFLPEKSEIKNLRKISNKIKEIQKVKATKDSSIDLAKFFRYEVERIAGKNGLPRSFTDRNDEESKNESFASSNDGKKFCSCSWLCTLFKSIFGFEDELSETEKLETKILILRSLVYTIPVVTMFFVVYCENKSSDLHFWVALLSFFLISSYHLTNSIRELNVLKNMAASYRHRYIVAKTFASFVDGIAKTHPEMKDVVTKEAAIAMFKRDSSGYLSKNQMEPANTPVQEVIGVFNKGGK